MLFSFIPSPGGWDDANLLELEDKVENPCFNLYPGQPYQHVGLCLNVFPYPAEFSPHSIPALCISCNTAQQGLSRRG